MRPKNILYYKKINSLPKNLIKISSPLVVGMKHKRFKRYRVRRGKYIFYFVQSYFIFQRYTTTLIVPEWQIKRARCFHDDFLTVQFLSRHDSVSTYNSRNVVLAVHVDEPDEKNETRLDKKKKNETEHERTNQTRN